MTLFLRSRSARIVATVPCVLAASLIVVAVGAAPAFASCVPQPPLAQAIATGPVVFVGLVTATSDGNRTAQVNVEAVWKGPSLPATVQVNGSLVHGENVMTSVDRRFHVGERYLFIPRGDQSGPVFEDTACSPTTVYDVTMARFAPAQPRGPSPSTPGLHASSRESSTRGWLIGVIALVAALLVASGVMLRRRRGKAHP